MTNDSKTLELQIRIAAAEALRAVSSLKGEIKTLADEAKKFEGTDGNALKHSFQGAQAAAEKAAASMKLFGASSSDLRRVQNELKTAAVELVTKGIDPQSKEIKKLVDEYKKLEKSADELDAANGKNIHSFGDLKQSIMGLAQVAAALKALTVVKDMGAFALEAADNFQTARNQFGTLLGDMEAGAGLFNEIKAFNDKTPFDLDTLTQATNVLLAAKVPLKDLQSELTKFGDLSQGNSQKFTSYINAFSKAAARGKADMEMLNTYLNQGVPILDELAENFGVTTEEIVEMTSKGLVSFADFSQALEDLTSQGGMYFGGMELGSQSLTAMQEGLNESINTLAASFGEMLLPAAIDVVSALTSITNTINDSPILKGLLAGALVLLTGYLAAMAVKATVAFAAQMSLNFAIGAVNPVVLAATVAAAGLAAGYTILASDAQKAARETENLALAQQKQTRAAQESLTAVQAHYQAVQNYDLNATLEDMKRLEGEIEAQRNAARQSGAFLASSDQTRELRSTIEHFKQLRSDFIKDYYNTATNEKIAKLNQRIEIAQTYMVTVDIAPEEKTQLESIIHAARREIAELEGDINAKAAKWKEDWAEIWNKSQAGNDPFYDIELERKKKHEDAYLNYVGDANKATHDEINAYYNAQRSEVIKQLADEEARIQRELTQTKVDDLEYELQTALETIDTLEAQRVIAAEGSEEDIAAIRERFAAMREDTELEFNVKIEEAALEDANRAFEEAKASIVDWQTALSDSLSKGLFDMEIFADETAIILGNLAAGFIELSASAALTGFEEFGRALGEAEEDSNALGDALTAMAEQILQQLPTMFLQAGLQLIANGQWALGLGFIAAGFSSGIISGYVQGVTGSVEKEADKNAKGGVFDEYGKAARAFAQGGTFTNQIVNQPTYFKHGGGLGLMGEAGPEAIVPLKRMANGNLGVEAGLIGGGGTQVIVNIINNSGAEVHKEETTDSDGNKQLDIIIGGMMNNHISSGKADKALGGRYGLRPQGV